MVGVLWWSDCWRIHSKAAKHRPTLSTCGYGGAGMNAFVSDSKYIEKRALIRLGAKECAG